MATVPSKINHRTDAGTWRWVFALAVTSLVAIAGLTFALHQFILKYLYDQSSYTRTPGGVLMILLGFAGICLPIALYHEQGRFQSLPPSWQWLVPVGVAITYVLALAACLEASHRSRTTILPRPFAPTAIVKYRPGDSRVEFRGGWRPDVGLAGYNDAEVQPDGSEAFSSYLHESFIRDAIGGRETVAIVGRATRGKDGDVQIILDVVAKEAIRFAVENLDNVSILRDGQPLAPSQLQSGIFEVTITGRLRNNARPVVHPPALRGDRFSSLRAPAVSLLGQGDTMSDMNEFFARPGVRHRTSRDWPDGGRRHWFKVDPALTPEEIRSLLAVLPVGAYVKCFDREYDSPSDPGAWVSLQRYSQFWTATFENHGWSSSSVPIAFEDAALLFWECRDFDYCQFLGVRDESELMAHSGLSEEFPKFFDSNPNSQLARHIRQRVASIKEALRDPPENRGGQ